MSKVKILFLLLLLSCEAKDRDFHENYLDEGTVSIKELEKKITSLKSDELPDLIIETVKSKANNKSEIEEWLLNEWHEGNITFDEFSESQAKQLLELLFDSETDVLDRDWSYALLSHNRLKENIEVKGLSYILLAKEYNFQRNKDSLSKYVHLLNEVKEKDTSSFVNRSYHLHNAYLSNLEGRYLDAIISYHKALEFVSENDTSRLFSLNQNIATLYIDMDQVEKAYHYLQESIRYKPWEEMPLDHLNTIGIILRSYGDYEQSEKVFKNLVQEAKAKNIHPLLAQTYSNYASLKIYQKKYEEALELLNKSDSICQSIQLPVGELFNLINRGLLYLKQNQFKESVIYYERAHNLFDNFQLPKVEVIILKGLYASYEGLNRKDIAFDYYKKYISQKEKIIGDAPNTLIAEWKLSQSEYANKINEAGLQSVKKQQRLQQIIFGVISIMILIIVVFIFLYQKKKKTIKEQKLQQERQEMAFQLEIKTKELLSESIKNLSIQNTKKSIYEDLVAIVNELPKTHSQKFESLMRTLKVNNEQQFIDEFDSRFVGVYESFYQKIIEMAPTLTTNEIRLCAMMRINLTSKEIAVLTNRTYGTIENIRSDIRKKLNVPNAINLQDFILKL